MNVIKIAPEGSCTVVSIDKSLDLWTAIKTEFNRTSLLGYHTVITRARDAIYEFFYDDLGDWACAESHRNAIAEDLTGLVWYGPCIIAKLDTSDANLHNDSDFEDVIYNDSKQYTDVVKQDQDISEFVHNLRLTF